MTYCTIIRLIIHGKYIGKMREKSLISLFYLVMVHFQKLNSVIICLPKQRLIPLIFVIRFALFALAIISFNKKINYYVIISSLINPFKT